MSPELHIAVELVSTIKDSWMKREADKAKRVEELIRLMNDQSAEYGERGDAVKTLSQLDVDPLLYEDTLIDFAGNRDEDIGLIEDAAEELACLWLKRGVVLVKDLRRLRPEAKRYVVDMLIDYDTSLPIGDSA